MEKKKQLEKKWEFVSQTKGNTIQPKALDLPKHVTTFVLE
jgi:hypothetical protein